METGLYGQNERGGYFAARADQNRFDDVESEKSFHGMLTENDYRHLMADQVVLELKSCKAYDKFVNELAEIDLEDLNGEQIQDIVLTLAISKEEIANALEKRASLFWEMINNGFSQIIAYNALTVSYPMAIGKLWKERQQIKQAKPTRMRGRCRAKVVTEKTAELHGKS